MTKNLKPDFVEEGRGEGEEEEEKVHYWLN